MGKSLKNMMGRLLIIALAVCFCDAAPTTDLVVPEYLDFAAFSKLAPTAFLQAVIKSGGTEAECRSFATTTIDTISESVKSEGAILNAVDTGTGCASKGQELVQVAQGRLEAKEGVLAAKEGSAEEARNAKTAACTAAVDMSVGLDTLKKTTCYDYSSEASFISTDAACNQATIASSQAAAAVVSATTDVQYAQGEVQDAVAEAARLESGCLCRVHQEQAAAQVAAQTATTAHADDWKQAQEVLCAVDQTTPCPMPPCPTVTQPTLAAGVANADTQHCTPAPTTEPTATPTATPTAEPTAEPTATPTASPTPDPTANPTKHPTKYPTKHPTKYPTKHPTPDPKPTATAANGQSWTASQRVCINQGKQLCTFDKICPKGEGSYPVDGGSSVAHDWSPMLRADGVTNDWVHISSKGGHSYCKPHGKHHGLPAWGTQPSNIFNHKIYCCG